MAQTPRSKRLSQQEKQPAALSSSEDEGESGEEESSEEEPPQTKKVAAPPAAEKKQSKKPAAAKKPKPSSESDRPPQVVSKPIASKPVDDGSKLKKKKKKARSKSTADVPSTPTTKSTGKRPAENTGGEVKDSKRAVKKMKGAEASGDAAEKMKGAEAGGDAAEKMKGAEADGDAAEKKEKKEAGEESSKRPLFQRLWSDGDEIVVLEGLAELVKKGVADPPSDVDAFLASIKKSLSIVVAKSQLAEKIKRLKKRYFNNAKKGKNGADRTFSNPHEQKVFNLSKPVWGGIAHSGGGGGPDLRKSKSNGKTLKVEVKEDLEEEFLLRMFRGVGKLDDGFVKRGLALLDPAIKANLAAKYRKLEFDALKLRLCQASLLKEQLELSVEGHEKEFT